MSTLNGRRRSLAAVAMVMATLPRHSLNNFIPQVWAARLLANLHKSHVYGQTGIVNRDYEGEIANMGDTVRINAIGTVTVKDYAKNTDIAAPDELQDAQTMLTIDRSKYFNFAIDDVDKRQGNPAVMDAAMGEAAHALSDAADQYIAGLYVGAAAANLIGDDTTPKTDLGTEAKAYNYLVDLGVKLDEANIPKAGRWVVLPPWYYGLLLKDQRFVSFGTQQNRDTLANGEIGQAAGFRVLTSNNVPNTASAKYKVIAGYPGAISYAEQINKVEAYRPERRFADALKGLHLYGAKLVRPTGLAILTANNPG